MLWRKCVALILWSMETLSEQLRADGWKLFVLLSFLCRRKVSNFIFYYNWNLYIDFHGFCLSLCLFAKAVLRSRKCYADSTFSPHNRQPASTATTRKCCQRRIAGWWPMGWRAKSVRSVLEKDISTSSSGRDICTSFSCSCWIGSGRQEQRMREEEEERKLYFNNLLHIHQHTFLRYMIQSVIEGNIRRQICLYTIFSFRVDATCEFYGCVSVAPSLDWWLAS